MAGTYLLIAVVDLVLLGWTLLFAAAARGPLSEAWRALTADELSADGTHSGAFAFGGEVQRHRQRVTGPLSEADCVAYEYAVTGVDLISTQHNTTTSFADGLRSVPFSVDGDTAALAVDMPDAATLSVPSDRESVRRTRSAGDVVDAFGDVLSGEDADGIESFVDGLSIDRWLTCREKALVPGDDVTVYGTADEVTRTTERGREYVAVPAESIDAVVSRPRWSFLLRRSLRGTALLAIGLSALGAIALVDYVILYGYPF